MQIGDTYISRSLLSHNRNGNKFTIVEKKSGSRWIIKWDGVRFEKETKPIQWIKTYCDKVEE